MMPSRNSPWLLIAVQEARTAPVRLTRYSYETLADANLSMANSKFAINSITKRLLQQLLTQDDANVKRCCKTSQTTV